MAKRTKNISNTAKKVVGKTKETVKKTGEYVSENPKTALYIGVGALAIIIGFNIVKSYKKASDKVSQILDGDPEIDDNVEIIDVPTPKATIDDRQASILAGQLLDAMNAKQPLYGTDEDTIEAVFDVLKSDDDFVKIFKAFGLKDYNGHNSPPTGIWSNLDSYKKQHLVYWLHSELDPSDGEVYKKVKSRVESAGFVFKK